MKRILLLPIGLIPLVAGFGFNYLIMNLNFYGTKMTLISIAFLLFWFFIGYNLGRIKIDFPSIVGFSLAFAMINYIFILYQLLVMDRWSGNIFGMLSQFYILPSLGIVSIIDFLNLFNRPLGYTSCAMFLLVFVFCMGVYIQKFQKIRHFKGGKNEK